MADARPIRDGIRSEGREHRGLFSFMLSQIRLPSPDMIIEGKRKGEPKMAILGWLVISGI